MLETQAQTGMSVSAIFVLDLKGRVLLSRDYRGDVSLKVAEKFIIKLNELEEAGKVRQEWDCGLCRKGLAHGETGGFYTEKRKWCC